VALAVAATAAAVVLAASTPASAATDRQSSASAQRRTGNDISHPQCGDALPANAAFGVVGVDGGRVLRANPCLVDEIAWAMTTADPEPTYYVNSANPGPLLSRYWPRGQQEPQVCAADRPQDDSTECAYDYGWNAAADSWGRAQSAAAAAGAPDPAASDWWVDVETGNSWQALEPDAEADAQEHDSAALRGMVDFLHRQGVASVGIYSTASQWEQITGGATLAAAPVWYAGGGSVLDALERCDAAWSFTGGSVRLSQYDAGGVDGDYRCG
jgi:hypothetical protein